MVVTVVEIPDDNHHWYEKIQQHKNKDVPYTKENPRPLHQLLLQLCESGCYVGRPSAFIQRTTEDSVQIIPHSDIDGTKIHSQAVLVHHVKQKPYFKMFMEALEKEKHIKEQRNESCLRNKSLDDFKREGCEGIEQRTQKDYRNLSKSLASDDCKSVPQELKIIPISDLYEYESSHCCSEDLQIIDKSRMQEEKTTKHKEEVIKKFQLDLIVSRKLGGSLGSYIFNSAKIKSDRTFISSTKLYKMCKDNRAVTMSPSNEDILHALVRSSILKGNTVGMHGQQENSKEPGESEMEEKGLVVKIPNLPIDIERTDHTPRYKYLTGFEDRPWACNYCKGRFTTKTYLKQHLKTHTGEKPYECDVCHARFREQAGLKRHTMTHTGERPFKCHRCDKAYTDKAVLIEHQRIHTGEKPYLCHICSKPFSYLFSFKQHMKRHSGERDHKCEVCDAKFYTATSLATHRKTHTGERDAICEVCGKAFVDKSHLKRHMKIHLGVKSVVCDVCDARFYRHDALRVHMRKHTGEKPYFCSICKKKFSDRKACHMHMEKHQEEPELTLLDSGSQAVGQGTCHEMGGSKFNKGAEEEYEQDNPPANENYETSLKYCSESQGYISETSKILESHKNSLDFQRGHETQRNSASPKHQQPSQKCAMNAIEYPGESSSKYTLNTVVHHQMAPHPKYPADTRYQPEHYKFAQDASKYLTDPQKYLQELHRYQQEPQRYLQDLQRFQQIQEQQHPQQQNSGMQEHQHNQHLLPQHQQHQMHQPDSHKYVELPGIRSAAADHFQPNLMGAFAHHFIASAPSEHPQGYFQNHRVWTTPIPPSNLAWGGSTMWGQGNFGGYRP